MTLFGNRSGGVENRPQTGDEFNLFGYLNPNQNRAMADDATFNRFDNLPIERNFSGDGSVAPILGNILNLVTAPQPNKQPVDTDYYLRNNPAVSGSINPYTQQAAPLARPDASQGTIQQIADNQYLKTNQVPIPKQQNTSSQIYDKRTGTMLNF